MYLDLPTFPPNTSLNSLLFGSKENHVALLGLLESKAFWHLCYNCSREETPSQLRALRSQPSNPNRRTVKRVINPALSRLHLLVGPDAWEDAFPEHVAHKGFLRELVYTATHYREANDWGPFHEDGTVDWVLLDALGTIMSGWF